ncbi:MAG: hypothetical protein Q8Q01_01735 [archaeon]|nr:hypothetical protein [archaeon]
MDKMEISKKTLGYSLIVLSVLLSIIIIFFKVDFDSQAVFLCEAVENDPVLKMEDCPAHTSSIPWLIILAFAVNALIFVVGLYLAIPDKKKINEPRKSFMEFDSSLLNKEEETVYNYIKEKGGSVYQSDIVKSLDMSKVKITRILDTLEHDHNLMERKRRGMTNIIVLK